FVDAASGDLHLVPGVPAVDAGAARPRGTTDYDLESRPAGLAPDVGADELHGLGTLSAPVPPSELGAVGSADVVDLSYATTSRTGAVTAAVGGSVPTEGDLDADWADLKHLLLLGTSSAASADVQFSNLASEAV